MHRAVLPVTFFALSAVMYAASDELRGLLANRVDESKRAVGMVAGTIDASGRAVIPYGKPAKDSTESVTGDTIFEIGSVTNVFTSLLLADMVERGEVQMDTPVAELLPGLKIPFREGKKITLQDLAMHFSGLPRMPTNMAPKNLRNIYADYTPQNLTEFFSDFLLDRNPGGRFEYSNLGMGLLGYALAKKSGMTYEQLLHKRILDPLGMNDTGITLTAEQKKRMATGYNPALEPTENWDFDVLAGCGALRSTANDMLKLLAANLELTDTPLKAAMSRMRSVRRDTGTENLSILLGWQSYKKYDTDIAWHNGSTGGFWSFLGFDPAKKTGVVILCNTYLNIDDLGLHSIESQWPVKSLEPPKQVTEMKLDPKILARYVGEYQFDPRVSLKVTLEDGHLYGEPGTQPRFELIAERETEFFVKVLDTQITFVKDAKGKVTGLVLKRNGKSIRAEKVH